MQWPLVGDRKHAHAYLGESFFCYLFYVAALALFLIAFCHPYYALHYLELSYITHHLFYLFPPHTHRNTVYTPSLYCNSSSPCNSMTHEDFQLSHSRATTLVLDAESMSRCDHEAKLFPRLFDPVIRYDCTRPMLQHIFPLPTVVGLVERLRTVV